jgi:hypothetical protein
MMHVHIKGTSHPTIQGHNRDPRFKCTSVWLQSRCYFLPQDRPNRLRLVFRVRGLKEKARDKLDSSQRSHPHPDPKDMSLARPGGLWIPGLGTLKPAALYGKARFHQPPCPQTLPIPATRSCLLIMLRLPIPQPRGEICIPCLEPSAKLCATYRER